MATASLDVETSKKVIRQVEFYFSDSNLPRDAFLSKTINESEDGMVSLSLICSFSRMRNHLGLGDAKQEDIPEDTIKAVAETLKSSSFLKVSDDDKKIGRTTKLSKPEEIIEQLDAKTIAASPLEYNVKLEDVESFFSQFAKVTSVRLPRHVSDNRQFCGTALVEFSSEEDASNVLKQSLVYSGASLELKPKKDFDAERAKLVDEVSRSNTSSSRNNNSDAEGSYSKGLVIAFTLKRKSAGDSVNDATENNEKDDEKAPEAAIVDEGNPKEESETKSEEKVEEELEGEKVEDGKESLESPVHKDEAKASGEGKETSAKFNKDNMDVVLREDLKSIFQKFGFVKYVDFTMGQESGYIRFEDAEAAQKARAAAVLAEEGGLVVKNYVATLEPVTGEAEKEYWDLVHSSQEKYKGNRGRGGRFSRGGRGKHSRSRDNNYSNRPSKAQKVGAK